MTLIIKTSKKRVDVDSAGTIYLPADHILLPTTPYPMPPHPTPPHHHKKKKVRSNCIEFLISFKRLTQCRCLSSQREFLSVLLQSALCMC